MSVPSSGLLKATRRMNPKYTTIIAMVSAIATRHRAAASASRGSVEPALESASVIA